MASSGLAPGLSRKVSRILELRTETPELVNAMSALSTFYESNTASDRRHLRATIERRGISINAEYLAAAESVIKALDGVQGDLDGLMLRCRKSQEAISSAQASTSGLLSETERLQQDLAANEKRSELVQRFLQQYQLSSQEVEALQSPEIGAAFFSALDRVRSIHSNCKALLRTHHQRAGLELMDSMSSYQETAYERLCRWVQSECRKLGESDAPEVASLLQQASSALRERPVLFKYCAMEVATTRHNALFQRFIAALTRGGPNGLPRPIEMHAHDPRRYLGDMLAWVHQSLASERELIVGLFGDDSQRDQVALSSSGRLEAAELPPNFDMPKSAALLDRVFEGICRPLKVRIEQVLLATPPLLLCFNLGQLLGFYTTLVDRLLGSNATLTRTLAGCRQLASRLFHEQLKKAGDRLVKYPPQPPKDLSPPPQFVEAFQQLTDIVAAFEASFEADEGDGGENEMAPVLSAAVDPLISAIQASSEALSPKASGRVDEKPSQDPSTQRLYLINCLAVLEQILSGHKSCRSRSAEVAKTIEQQVSALVRGHAGSILLRSGVAEITDRMRLYREGRSGGESAMADDSALALSRIAQAVKSFTALLSQPEAQPEFRSLQVPRMRTEAVSRVATTLADAYQLVYECITDPNCGYPEDAAQAAALKNSPEEIRTILGIM